jgi:hypothetical protein
MDERAASEYRVLAGLKCAECGQYEVGAATKGWRALLGREYPEAEPEVVVFCPECAEREFGPER